MIDERTAHLQHLQPHRSRLVCTCAGGGLPHWCVDLHACNMFFVNHLVAANRILNAVLMGLQPMNKHSDCTHSATSQPLHPLSTPAD